MRKVLAVEDNAAFAAVWRRPRRAILIFHSQCLTFAKVLIDMREKEQAKVELEKVLHLETPSDPNFYRLVNLSEARWCWEKVKDEK